MCNSDMILDDMRLGGYHPILSWEYSSIIKEVKLTLKKGILFIKTIQWLLMGSVKWLGKLR